MPYTHHSLELKKRAIYLLDHPELVSNVPAALSVSKASLWRWRSNLDRYGSVNRPKRGITGRPRLLNASNLERLRNYIHSSPHLYLCEIREWLRQELNTVMSITSVYRNIGACGLTRKKLRLQAIERDEEEIQIWKEETARMFSAEQLISIDESSKDGRTLYRQHGWALRGETPVRMVDFPRGERWSLLPALTIDGYIATRVVEGSVDAGEFIAFILEDVLPLMNPFPLPQSVILMDNCSIHKSDCLRTAVEAKGCRIHFLPPYAPELNPIEESFAAVKSTLRRDFHELGQLAPEEALLVACETVTAQKAHGWFRHSGYYCL